MKSFSQDDIFKIMKGCTVYQMTRACNLEINDIVFQIGCYIASSSDIPNIKIVDIDYNPAKPNQIIFELDTELYPVNSKYITVFDDTEVVIGFGNERMLSLIQKFESGRI